MTAPCRRGVVLTRPEGRNEALAHRLQAWACPTLVLPALEIVPLPDPTDVLPLPGDYDLVVFVSGAAARAYAGQLRRLANLQQWPLHVPVACVGAATAAAMRGDFWPAALRILHPDASAAAYDSEALWQVLNRSGLSLRRVLLVRGTAGREWLAQRLIQARVAVDRHAVYRRQAADWPDSARHVLSQWRADGLTPIWLLTSGEGLDAVWRQIQQADMQLWWRSHGFVLPHPRLRKRLFSLTGWTDKEARAMVKISLPRDEDIEQAVLALCSESP